MDRFGEWRSIEPAAGAEGSEVGRPATETPAVKSESSPVRLVALLAAAVLGIAGAAIWLTSPQPSVSLDVAGRPANLQLSGAAASYTPSASAAAAVALIVVDVEGAVARPGLQWLPSGSRIGDAIAAAGGYGPRVDIAATAAQVNLAEKLTDGAKIHVPALGETVAAGSPPPAGDAPAAVGLIELNSATAEQLDTLPGIGPVTAEKILGARDQARFASVDELLSREIVGPSTFEKIRDLVTVSP